MRNNTNLNNNHFFKQTSFNIFIKIQQWPDKEKVEKEWERLAPNAMPVKRKDSQLKASLSPQSAD